MEDEKSVDEEMAAYSGMWKDAAGLKNRQMPPSYFENMQNEVLQKIRDGQSRPSERVSVLRSLSSRPLSWAIAASVALLMVATGLLYRHSTSVSASGFALSEEQMWEFLLEESASIDVEMIVTENILWQSDLDDLLLENAMNDAIDDIIREDPELIDELIQNM